MAEEPKPMLTEPAEHVAGHLRRRYEDLINSIDGLVWEADAQTFRFTFVSPQAERLLGYPCAQWLDEPAFWRDHIHPEDRDEAVKYCVERTAKKETHQFEYRMIAADGRVAWLHDFVTVQVENDRPVTLRGVMVDITERKRTEEALRQSEERFAKAFRSLAVGVSIVRVSDGCFLEVNDAFVELFGFAREEVVGHTSLELGMWADSQVREESLARLRAEGSLKNMEGKARKKSGELAVVLLTLELVEMGGEKCILGLFTDITERKRTEERIREQARLLDLAQDAIIVRDLEGRIQFWNKAAERFSGWTAEEVIGHKVAEQIYKDPTEFEAIQKQLREKGEWAGEIRLVGKGGREMVLSSRSTLLRDESGNPKSVLVINTDITDKKKLEAQFLRAQRMEGLGMLASGIAHDLNNILTPILLAVPMIREGSVDAKEIPKMLDMIRVNAQRGADIIKQLLTFGRGAAGQQIVVQPRHVVKDMVKMAQETFPKNILVNLQVADDLWTVIGDPTQLHQVLLNLSLNARDAMPGGGMLTMAAENIVLDDDYATQNLEAKAGSYVLLNVSDTGVGIAPEIIDKIFDPFFTTKDVGKGTGLGLSTVLGIVKGHGGFVKIYSEPGRGSTVAVYLPAIPEGVEPGAAPKADALPCGQGELILVVDDERPILELTRKILERHGYQALTANDGTEALSLFAQWQGKIRVVLTDVSMPVMDGVALVRVLRKMEPELNVIAASGRGSGGKASDLKTLGINKFLTKPYAAEKLMMALQELLVTKPA